MKYILKGGTVVGGSVSQRADLLIDGEKIAAVGENLCVEGAQVVDVTGKLLFPGFIDAHTHFDLDVCNTTPAADFPSGTRWSLTLRAPTRVRRSATGFRCGTKRRMEGPPAITASI